MPCLVGCLALIAPRVAIILVWIFGDLLQTAYQTTVWPVLGFLFMPVTTLAYAWAWHMEPEGSVQGLGLAIVVIAVLMDLGIIGGNAEDRRRRSAERVR
jgi:hypothetical protein